MNNEINEVLHKEIDLIQACITRMADCSFKLIIISQHGIDVSFLRRDFFSQFHEEMEKIRLDAGIWKCFWNTAQQPCAKIADRDIKFQIPGTADIHGIFPGVCCSGSSRLEQIDIAGIRINTCQDRIPTLEDFIIGTLPDTGKVNRFIKFCCTCGCLIQDLADLTDGNMFLKIIFKDPALHGMI